ncbi:MAG: TonB-dependent receptor [Undibacterium sp.]|uniref:TonB-dependent receptor n=1 Tax=Undibacterium sp. TaxID=1914977 RepID=UPI002728B0F6|nr:TonB-dependent receptor [Undibacterium sp.]MDO8652670.1 TonB-dependent receptor [Undibacterium sp.]
MRLTKKNMQLLRHSATAAAALALSGAAGAQTQTVPSADTATSAETATVMVTARRREESLQDVPVSVTAYSADQLSKTGIPDITGLAQTLPNTTLKASRATNSTLTAFIRGVGQQDPLAGFESGVGIYMDDIFLARPQGAVADIYDVERIEVLRGPQGTLYGRNTIGGAVKYVTRKLGPTPDLRLKTTVGSYGQTDAVLTGSTPLSDTVRIGATLAKFKRDGFGKNLTTGGDNYDKDISAGRVSLELTPSSSLFIRLAADASQDDSSPKNGHRLVAGKTSGAPLLDNVFDTQAGMVTTLGHAQQVKAHGESALIEWQINPELTLKSITASRHDTSYAPIDFDSLAKVDFEAPAVYKNSQFSQELQLTYSGSKVQGVAGVYYIDANAFDKFDAVLAFAPPLTAFNRSIFTKGDIDTKAWAVFADASINLTDAFSLSAGGRYTEDRRQASILRTVYAGLNGSPEMGNPGATLIATDTNLINGELDRTDKKFTPRVSASWKASAEQNLYASYAQGFKGGGFDPRIVAPTAAVVAVAKQGFLPETISTFELGLKSQFNQGRILTNIAVFSSDYKDVQIPSSIPIDTNGDGKDDSFAGATTNAGKAKIKGIELEASARVTDSFSLSGMLSYIDAQYKEFIILDPVSKTLINVASQRAFQNTPKYSASLRANYDWALPVAGRAGKLSLIGMASYKGDTQQFELANALLDQSAYTLWDASLVWTSSDSHIRVGLHGKNLSDAHYKVAGYLFPTLGAEGTTSAFYGNPRTVSATLEYRF